MRSFIKETINKAGFEVYRNEPTVGGHSQSLIKKNAYFPNYGILDTSVGSKNLGDFIIMEAIDAELNKLFDNQAYFTTFPTHLRIGQSDRQLLAEKELLFVCGTNLLNSAMDRHLQWNVQKQDWAYFQNRCVLTGVGWGKYDIDPSPGTREMLKRVLSDEVLHSVRDEYSKNMLHAIGITNVVNTCCPTTWNITVDPNNDYKKNQVVTTITDYHEDLERDTWMLNFLLERYEQVHLWIQSIEDLGYVERMNINQRDRLKFIAPSLAAYRSFLDVNWQGVDYIGTRLHAGIYAMQRNIRTLIIGIDNRALEISRDVGICVVKREEIEDIRHFLEYPRANALRLPYEELNKWKECLVSFK